MQKMQNTQMHKIQNTQMHKTHKMHKCTKYCAHPTVSCPCAAGVASRVNRADCTDDESV